MITVSVIMPVYNSAEYLREALDSVLFQTYKDFEFIVIDDGSTDQSSSILSEYQKRDKRLNILSNELNLGVVKSLNIGLGLAKGRLIARIDADDIWNSDKLEKQVHHLESDNELFLSATAKININEDGSIRENDRYPQYFMYDEIKRNILKRNIFCHSSVVFRHDVINIVGMYNESYVNSEDYEYWIRIMRDLKIEILPEPLVYYRISKNSISSKRIREQRYYAIKAKISGIKTLNKSLFYLIYIFEDLIYLVHPKIVNILGRIDRRLRF